MATQPTPSPTTITPTPKVSWLKKLGQDVVKVLDFLAGKAPAIAQAAGAVAETLLPQFAPEINFAENLVSKIAHQSQVTEGAFAAVGQASNGAAKLQAVLGSVGPEIDAWVTNSFPGATAVSTVAKTGLVNAVVSILNDIKPTLALTATASATSAAAAASAAVTASKT
jgi:hypothetical protein